MNGLCEYLNIFVCIVRFGRRTIYLATSSLATLLIGATGGLLLLRDAGGGTGQTQLGWSQHVFKVTDWTRLC